MTDKSEYAFLSTLERKVWDWLTRNNISFQTEQVMLAEAREIGSAVVDFLIPDKNLILRVMGSYWHSGLTSKARDEMTKIDLMNQGYTVVDIWEENLSTAKIDRTLRMAIEGQEVII